MPNSLIFIDNRISNRTELLKQLPTDSRIIELNATQDGLQQIADAVSAYRNLDSIHLISHGSAGALYLGNSVLNSQTLPNYSAVLNTIGNSLSSTGDMLLYGCNVGQGKTGSNFIKDLSKITGADIAASNNLTGHNGDSILELKQGSIEAEVLNLNDALGNTNLFWNFIFDAIIKWAATAIIDKIFSTEDNEINSSSAVNSSEYNSTPNSSSVNDVINVTDSMPTTDLSSSYDDSYYSDTSYDDSYYSDTSYDDSYYSDTSYDDSYYSDTSYDDSYYSDTSYDDSYYSDTSYDDSYYSDTSYDDSYYSDTSYDDSYYSNNLTISGTAIQGETLTAISILADTDGLGEISYQWLADGVAIEGETTTSLALTQALVDKAISVQASYTDELGMEESVASAATRTVVNVNDAPTGRVTIGGTATQNQTLTARNTLADADGLGEISYQWLADGVAIEGETTTSLALTQALVDKAISVQASYTDGLGMEESVASAATRTVVNVNDAPTGRVTIGGTATQNQTLTARNTLADADGLGEVSYQWLADGVAIEGETTTSLALTQALVGKAISVQASYTDGFGMAESVTSAATRTVVNVNDAPSGSVTISGIAAQNETLTASNTLADDADGMGVISYQWLANGRVISGATGETLTLTQAQVGKAISVQASYTDGQNTLERITSTATQAITNVNDAPTGSVAISGTATQGRTLTATNTLADADGMGALAYQWLADGVVINGATARTFQLTQSQVGKLISVRVNYTDAQGTAESITSSETNAVLNINDAPTGSVTISGLIQGDALVGHQLTAVNTLTDIDGLGTFSYQWLANGAVIRDATNSTFTPTILQQGKQITVKVQYTDAFGTRETIQSAAVTSATDSQYGDSVRVGSSDRLQGGIFASDLYGYSGNDELRGGAGEDRLYGGYGDDLLYGEADNDELEGDQGNDKLYGDTGNDILTGGTGKDSLYGGDGNDVLDGSSDIDFMDGGNGADTYYVDNKGDIVRDSGTDSAKDVLYITAYLQGGYVLGAGIDNAVLSALANNAALTGNAGNNTLTGNTSANNLKGGVGIDTLKGGAGNDTLIGGAGKDVLNGGTGKDIFKLEKLIESGVTAAERDVVQGFVRGQDKLGLSALDANTAVAGDQSFDTIISRSATFTQAGQLQLKEGILYGNTDADAAAEFSIALTGITTLTLADIIA